MSGNVTGIIGSAAYVPPESDQPARDRIVSDLSTNMLVEAGAGSGKTTSLVDRMVALVAQGTPIDQIAAVTFTRKAANELRERFQLRLEQRLRENADSRELAAKYSSALRELDRAFLGTIHSFCSRLLHERPLEVSLDPNFSELEELEFGELRNEFWRRWIDAARRSNDSGLLELARVGVDPLTLFGAFALVAKYPDVDFPVEAVAAPDMGPCRHAILELLTSARRLIPRERPEDGWDKLMMLVRRLENHKRQNDDWQNVASFCEAIEGIGSSHCDVVQKRWGNERETKAAAKQLGLDFLDSRNGAVAELLRLWREHRYPIVMALLLRAVSDFERERHAIGQLGFEDLLLLAAKLLRENPVVRDELGKRYAHLLVDEFQDTDPIQAEVCFLLASPSNTGNDWRKVDLRPGGLFVVGDPKQSIYRFRRADIQIYKFVKQRLASSGVVLALTRNFRSVNKIGTVVNSYFDTAFPHDATAVQAPFSPMHTTIEDSAADGVFHYAVRPEKNNQDDIVAQDCEKIASWIAARIERDERKPGDFLVLTFTKDRIGAYARALGERNVPVTTTGAALPQEHELSELLVVLRAIADPENSIAIVAALEGLFFGLSPADLFDAHQLKLRFSITHPPSNEEHAVGSALMTLHTWWKISQRHPADVLIEKILDDTGLLYHAASQPLGDARAGALLQLVESLRGASVNGATALSDAMEHVEILLKAEAADAPLRPGRTDAVRVMNLHKAKGLEAEVVILAAPLDLPDRSAIVHVNRGEGERPTGGVQLQFKEHAAARESTVIAQPPGWAAMQDREDEFLVAERIRLLYVAATRAKRELVVSRSARVNKSSPVADDSLWSPLAPTLDALAIGIDLPQSPAPGRRALERELSSIQSAIAEANARVQASSKATLRVVTVTESAKQEREMQRAYDLPAGGAGVAWGRAVHRTLEGMGRGRTGDNLHAYISAVAADEGLTLEQGGELKALAAKVSESQTWRSLFDDGKPQFELSIMRRSNDDGVEVLTEGVIDAAVSKDGQWLVVDWKSDKVGEAAWRERLSQYERQVGSYADMVYALTGLPVMSRVERVVS
jgi:ATP-dependent helicase/nuclease subunit A